MHRTTDFPLFLRTLIACLLLMGLAACRDDAPAQPSLPTAGPGSSGLIQGDAPALWVGNMEPAGGTVSAITPDQAAQVSIQVYRAGVTDAPGQGPGIECTLHWGVLGLTWSDLPMTYAGDAPGLGSATDNDRYIATLAPQPGHYGFTVRCEDGADGSLLWQSDGDGQLVVSDQAGQTPYTGPRTVFVHLFEWRWTDIAQECENWLGPKGFAAVQVSPPNEHLRPQDAPDFAWWVRYQPVSYKLESRSGTRAEFIDMVQRCKVAGVDVYVDAVINHMTGSESGVGSAGTPFKHYEYPDLDGSGRYGYGYQDFHHCGTPYDDISNYGDAWEVQTCELLNLADLDTGAPYVQERIAAYLQELVDIGVAGFRLDASKHMAPADIAGILGRVDGEFYVYQEVIDRGGEGISARDYLGTGDITEFNFGSKLSNTFLNGRLADLESFGEGWGLLPSADAVAFVDNHDNQRGHGGSGPLLTHRDGQLYQLGVVTMLAWPYGYPRVMSSYAWDGENDVMGPPSDNQGRTNEIYINGQPDCFGDLPGEDWICEHRWRAIANMVGFHNATSGNFFISNWWTNGFQQIAFGRGDAGFVVINREDFAMVGQRLQTSLPPGRYCDIIHGELSADGQSCTGPVITVQADGTISADVAPLDALAIHAGARLP